MGANESNAPEAVVATKKKLKDLEGKKLAAVANEGLKLIRTLWLRRFEGESLSHSSTSTVVGRTIVGFGGHSHVGYVLACGHFFYCTSIPGLSQGPFTVCVRLVWTNYIFLSC